MSNIDRQNGVDKDSDSNYVMEIDEASSTEWMENSTTNVDKMELVKNDKDLSEIRTCSTYWVRLCDAFKSFTVLRRSLFLFILGLAILMLVLLIIFQITSYYGQKTDKGSTMFSSSFRVNSSTTPSYVDETNNRSSVCKSPACVSAATRIVLNMNSTIDPCQDFYQYACGGWRRNNPIPSGYTSWSNFKRLLEEIQIVLKNIFDHPPETLESESEKRVHNFYQSCMNFKANKDLNLKTVEVLLEHIGIWPAEDVPTNWSFNQVLETFHNVLYSNGFFKWSLNDFDLDSETNDIISTIQINLPDMPWITLNKLEDRELVFNNLGMFTRRIGKQQEMELVNLMKTVPRHLFTDIEEVAKEIHIGLLAPPYRNSEFFSSTLEDFQNKYTFLNWTAYFQSAFSQVNISIKPSSHRVSYQVLFLNDLESSISAILRKSEGPRMLQNYIGSQVIASYLSNSLTAIDQSVSDNEVEVKNILYSRYCFDETNKALSSAVSALYIRQEFNVESRLLAKSMVSSVKETFEKNFDNLDWMDNETRLAAKDKADAMTDEIGYPTFISNRTTLDDFYNGLEINSRDYLKNKFYLNQFSARKNWMKLDKPRDKTLWTLFKPTDVNAYYNPFFNQIIIPAGLLRIPFFDISLPHSFNFGAIGAMIGHELTHGFDNRGRLYDKNGIKRQWWNNATIKRFNRQTECLIDQYSSYIDGQLLDVNETLGENIVDNGGLKAAFGAYEMWSRSQNEDSFMLPGLNLTHNQLFFISFAQAFCSSNFYYSADYVHSPDRYRVIGTVSNMIEFASEFHCPSGSPMNPQKKCQVW